MRIGVRAIIYNILSFRKIELSRKEGVFQKTFVQWNKGKQYFYYSKIFL